MDATSCVTVVEVTYAPGGSSPLTSSLPGDRYVLEGAYRTQVKGGPKRSTGRRELYEEPNGVHLISATPVTRASPVHRLLHMHQEAPLSIDVPEGQAARVDPRVMIQPTALLYSRHQHSMVCSLK